MAISLRIVGTFYRNDNIDPADASTVFEVLQAASANPGGTLTQCDRFDFTPKNGQDITSFLANYTQPVPSTVSSNSYGPGPFYLSENLTTKPAYSVWQYYILDADGKDVTRARTRISNKAGLSNIKPIGAVQVNDKEKVIFRLLNILADTNSPPQRAEKRMKG